MTREIETSKHLKTKLTNNITAILQNPPSTHKLCKSNLMPNKEDANNQQKETYFEAVCPCTCKKKQKKKTKKKKHINFNQMQKKIKNKEN